MDKFKDRVKLGMSPSAEVTTIDARKGTLELKDKLEGLIIDLDCGTQDAHDALRELLIFLLKELEK